MKRGSHHHMGISDSQTQTPRCNPTKLISPSGLTKERATTPSSISLHYDRQYHSPSFDALRSVWTKESQIHNVRRKAQAKGFLSCSPCDELYKAGRLYIQLIMPFLDYINE